MKRKIYIAGFDVFKTNAKEIGEQYKKLCDKYSFEGLYPLDADILSDKGVSLAEAIFKADINLIRESDIIVANLNVFRGHEPDSGTCFECGAGYALGKKLYGYLDDDREMIDKLPIVWHHAENNCYTDDHEMIIENFGLPVNLMLGVPIQIVQGTFEDCLKII